MRVQCVPDAYVPVIKLTFDGLELDMLYAQLNVSSIPDDFDVFDNNYLRNMDPKSVLSLNGAFTSHYPYL